MPHKHRRKFTASDANFDLPPTQKALPFPVGKIERNDGQSKNGNKGKKSKTYFKESVEDYSKDDTPKAFARLLAFQRTGKRVRNGLDDGPPTQQQRKKRKRDDDEDTDSKSKENVQTSNATSSSDQTSTIPLQIQPGEKLSDFAIRVDQAMPIFGISTKGKKVEGVRDHRQTKHERKLRRMQEMWREEEAKIREREEEEREQAEDEWEERLAGLDKEAREVMTNLKHGGGTGKKQKKRKQRMIGEIGDDDDPWAVLKTRREEPKGLFDVAQAPPKFEKLPREMLKQSAQVKDVPRAAGSLRRREDLGETRTEIIKKYRHMMANRNE